MLHCYVVETITYSAYLIRAMVYSRNRLRPLGSVTTSGFRLSFDIVNDVFEKKQSSSERGNSSID